MHKKRPLRLTEEERRIFDATIGKLEGSSRKARRARILRQVDEDGRGRTDRQVADAHRHRKRTVENVRWHCVLEGFEPAPNGKQRSHPPVPKRLNGEQEAQLIARMGATSDLRTQIAAWSTDVNPPQRGVGWRLKINAARCRLKAVYSRFNL